MHLKTKSQTNRLLITTEILTQTIEELKHKMLRKCPHYGKQKKQLENAINRVHGILEAKNSRTFQGHKFAVFKHQNYR